MKEPSKKIIYNVKGLSTEQYDELINYIQKYSDENKKGMDYLCAKEQRLEYKKNHYLHYNECAEVFAYLTKEQIKGSKPTANAKELFYTLENVQVDCSELTEEQIEEIAATFYEDGYEIGSLDLVEECCFIRKNVGKYCFVGIKHDDKTTITYDKFMELFSNKEENFKKLVEVDSGCRDLIGERIKEMTGVCVKNDYKVGNSNLEANKEFKNLVEVLNEELAEEAYKETEYEVKYIAEKPNQYQIGIDTFTRCESNMTKEECLAFAKGNIDKYNWRNKGQDLEDLEKIISYANWGIKQLKK